MPTIFTPIISWVSRSEKIAPGMTSEIVGMVREVMETDHKTFIYHLPLPTRDPVYICYPLEGEDGDALQAAQRRYHEIMALPRKPLAEQTRREIFSHVRGVLPQTLAAKTVERSAE